MYEYAKVQQASEFFNCQVSGFRYVVIYGENNHLSLQYYSECQQVAAALNKAYQAGLGVKREETKL